MSVCVCVQMMSITSGQRNRMRCACTVEMSARRILKAKYTSTRDRTDDVPHCSLPRMLFILFYGIIVLSHRAIAVAVAAK